MNKIVLRLACIGAAALIAAFAWFATGVEPFHVMSYLVVGIPVLVVAGLYVLDGTFSDRRSAVSPHYRRSLGVPFSRSAPWLFVLLGAVILEAVGLILGGRSSRLPTLSTIVDHLLTTHGLRWALFLLWLAIGAAPLGHIRRRRRDAVSP
jgi:hypothetical protein